jgi:hypothetical protein
MPTSERKRFRYDTSGRWCKGNTHIHSIVSDGGKNFKELAEMYASVGYDFLFRTDHRVVSEVTEDKEKYPLLYLDGIELDGKDETGAAFHIVCLGSIRGISGKTEDFVANLQGARSQALTILAHPHWMGNSFDDYKRWRFDGVEVYNHVCQWLNGKGSGLVYWTEALKDNPEALGFCADDAHITVNHPGWNGGWIVVNVKECSAEDITGSIRRGNFYSSCGPEIHSLILEGDKLHIKTSPVQFVRLVGQASQGAREGNFEGRLMTDLTMTVPSDWPFVYLEIEDGSGRRAWTNNLFTVSV